MIGQIMCFIYKKGMFHVYTSWVKSHKQLENEILPAVKMLREYEQLVLKWQKSLNLISKNDEKVLWQRHILDSAQVYFLLPGGAEIMIDMGSGGGFPALVVAILNKCLNGPLKSIILIESDSKKCVFLREVVRQLALDAIIINDRIENVADVKADVITARALSAVGNLVQWGRAFYKNESVFLLCKGENVDCEIMDNKIPCKIEKMPSLVNKTSCILKITEVEYEKA